jgi:hypothetical protein
MPRVIDELKTKLAQLEAQPLVSDEQISQIQKLQNAIAQLNRLNMKPLERAFQEMKQQIQQQTAGALTSFAQYLGGLLKGQQESGKSILQAAGDMIGGLIGMAGQLLVQIGVAECVAASTMIGRVLGHTYAAGLKAIAEGMALVAAGAALSSSSAASGSASAPSGGPAGVSTTQVNANPQTLHVGAPGSSRPPSPQQTQHLVLEVKSSDQHILKVVRNDLKTNGQLRVAVKKA